MSSEVVVVGSYNQDHVWHIDRVPQPGETRRGHGFSTGPGGKGFNQAVACARQDVATCFIGARGNDALGDLAAEIAEAEGLQCHWQVRGDVPTGSACIVVDDQSQNQIVVYLAANEHLDPAFLHAQSGAFHHARILLAQLENNLDATVAALRIARKHDLLRVLNPAPVHAELNLDVLHMVDVLMPNEGEFAQLCKRFLDNDLRADAVAAMDDRALHALARRLGNATVVITLGRSGCFVSHGDEHHGDDSDCYRLDAEVVRPLDTTGAGDAFCGALVAALARFDEQPFAQAVRHANRVGALATEHVGAAAAMPRLDDVIARFGT